MHGCIHTSIVTPLIFLSNTHTHNMHAYTCTHIHTCMHIHSTRMQDIVTYKQHHTCVCFFAVGTIPSSTVRSLQEPCTVCRCCQKYYTVRIHVTIDQANA